MHSFDDLPQILTSKQAATFMKMAASTAYKLIETGELPAIKIGRSVRILREDLIKFILDHRTEFSSLVKDGIQSNEK